MRRMISTAKLQQIEDGIENVTKVVPTSLNINVPTNTLYLEHDGQKLTGQRDIVLASSDFKTSIVSSKPTISVKHKQYQNHFVRIKLYGDGNAEFFFCLNIIDQDNAPIDSATKLKNHLKGSSHNALVTGYLRTMQQQEFQPMYIDDTLKVHGYMNGVLTPIQLTTVEDEYTLGTIKDDVTLL